MTDPDDPEAPVRLDEYNGMRPGDFVAYENPAFRQEDGTFKTGGMDETLVIGALYHFPPITTESGEPYVEAILNEGEWAVNADNLRKLA